MSKTGLYSLLVLGFVLMPIAGANREAPSITVKRAREIASSARGGAAFLLRYFWVFHLVLSVSMSIVAIVGLEWWQANSMISNAILAIVFCVLILASAGLSAVPSYVVVDHWRRRQAARRRRKAQSGSE